MGLFPVLVELLFGEIGPSLDEADDADVGIGRHDGFPFSLFGSRARPERRESRGAGWSARDTKETSFSVGSYVAKLVSVRFRG